MACARRGLISLKVVHHAADGVCALLPEGLQNLRVRLTGVEDDGFTEFEGQAESGRGRPGTEFPCLGEVGRKSKPISLTQTTLGFCWASVFNSW